MDAISLKAKVREETGKGPCRRARKAARVPAVVYGGKVKPLAVDVDRKELETVLRRAGENVVIQLEVEGARTRSPQTVMLREVQHSLLRPEVEHADFIRISLDEKVRLRVPVKATGESEGVKLGGILEHQLWELEVECLPRQIPESITVDVSALDIGQSIHVRDCIAPPGVVFLEEEDRTVISVAAPKKAEEEEEAAVAEVEGAPELVGGEEKEAKRQEKGAEAEGGGQEAKE